MLPRLTWQQRAIILGVLPIMGAMIFLAPAGVAPSARVLSPVTALDYTFSSQHQQGLDTVRSHFVRRQLATQSRQYYHRLRAARKRRLRAQRAAAAAAAARAARQAATQSQAPPASAVQSYAEHLVGSAQFGCLQSLWDQESGWNTYASNPSSGAYGIPQALPGSKMASAGPDWQTNPYTQVKWGVEDYIDPVYGSACAAWAHEQATGWY